MTPTDTVQPQVTRWLEIAAKAEKHTGDEGEDGHAIGVRDGFEEAVQLIDMLTGGDGEYRFSTDPERNCPTPIEMIANIVARTASTPQGADVLLHKAEHEILDMEPAVAHMSSGRKIDRKSALGFWQRMARRLACSHIARVRTGPSSPRSILVAQYRGDDYVSHMTDHTLG